MCAVAIYSSYPDLIKFHDFVDNSQEGMKHQMRGATQAQPSMTLQILYYPYQPPTIPALFGMFYLSMKWVGILGPKSIQTLRQYLFPNSNFGASFFPNSKDKIQHHSQLVFSWEFVGSAQG